MDNFYYPEPQPDVDNVPRLDLEEVSGATGPAVPLSYEDQQVVIVGQFPQVGVAGTWQNKLLIAAFEAKGSDASNLLALARRLFGDDDEMTPGINGPMTQFQYQLNKLSLDDLHKVLSVATPEEGAEILPIVDLKHAEEDELDRLRMHEAGFELLKKKVHHKREQEKRNAARLFKGF